MSQQDCRQRQGGFGSENVCCALQRARRLKPPDVRITARELISLNEVWALIRFLRKAYQLSGCAPSSGLKLLRPVQSSGSLPSCGS